MSDRSHPHVQKVVSGSGSTYGGNSLKRTLTRLRPGALSPGGAGVDIKHNSYDRYLLRLKGKGPVRRGVIPPKFGTPVPFNPAFPVYGGKTMKTSIVGDNCNCPITSDNQQYSKQNKDLYKIYFNTNLPENGLYNYLVGSIVYAMNSQGYYLLATIISIKNGIYNVKFEDGSINNVTYDSLMPYAPCNCNKPCGCKSYNGLSIDDECSDIEENCYILNSQNEIIC
jgi:hypothetical protein